MAVRGKNEPRLISDIFPNVATGTKGRGEEGARKRNTAEPFVNVRPRGGMNLPRGAEEKFRRGRGH